MKLLTRKQKRGFVRLFRHGVDLCLWIALNGVALVRFLAHGLIWTLRNLWDFAATLGKGIADLVREERAALRDPSGPNGKEP